MSALLERDDLGLTGVIVGKAFRHAHMTDPGDIDRNRDPEPGRPDENRCPAPNVNLERLVDKLSRVPFSVDHMRLHETQIRPAEAVPAIPNESLTG